MIYAIPGEYKISIKSLPSEIQFVISWWYFNCNWWRYNIYLLIKLSVSINIWYSKLWGNFFKIRGKRFLGSKLEENQNEGKSKMSSKYKVRIKFLSFEIKFVISWWYPNSNSWYYNTCIGDEVIFTTLK